MRQLLAESMLLALVAGALGAALGWAADRALSTWGTSELPGGIPVGMDLRVLVFTVLVSLLTGFVTGIFPAVQLARTDLNSTLRDEGRGISGGRARGRLKNLLVIGQVALSLLLLIGAGLLLRSFERLLRVDPGFAADHMLTMNVSLPTAKYAKPEQQTAFFDEVLRRVSALPGVRDAAISAALPLSWKRVTPLLPDGQPNVPLAQRPFIDIEAISPQWFRTMRVPMLGGRGFTAADDAHAPKVVIANEAFARRFWPGENPVGKHVLVGRGPEPSEVIGIAANIRNKGLAEETQAQLYLPFAQLPWGDMNLLVRTVVPPLSMAQPVRAQIAAVDPDQPVTAVQTVDDLMDGLARAAALHHAAAGGIFSYSPGVGCNRPLRCAGVVSRTAAAGDRNPAGAGGREKCSALGCCETGTGAGCSRNRDRTGRGIIRHATDGQRAIQDQCPRPDDICTGAAGVSRNRAAGELPARATCNKGRSAGGNARVSGLTTRSPVLSKRKFSVTEGPVPPVRPFIHPSKEAPLSCGEVPLDALARKYGTPLYVYSAESLLYRLQLFTEAFLSEPTPIAHLVCYAVKANPSLAILKFLHHEGAGFDIVSGGELERILSIDKAPTHRVVFSGVGKTAPEIDLALRSGILLFNIESEGELELVAERAAKLKKRARYRSAGEPRCLRGNTPLHFDRTSRAQVRHRYTTGARRVS